MATRVRAIYLTAHSDDDTLRRAMQTDPFGYLVKPFSARQLRCAIEVALHLRKINACSRLSEAEFERCLADDRSIEVICALTPAETRLAVALTNGESLRDFVRRTGVSIETARSQLKACFAKTGTHRQSELVCLLLKRARTQDPPDRRGR